VRLAKAAVSVAIPSDVLILLHTDRFGLVRSFVVHPGTEINGSGHNPIQGKPVDLYPKHPHILTCFEDILSHMTSMMCAFALSTTAG
jgi:hypothetical protein